MTEKQWRGCLRRSLGELCEFCPALGEYLDALQIPLYEALPLQELPDVVSDRWLRDKGLSGEELLAGIRELLEEENDREWQAARREAERKSLIGGLEELSVCAGSDKDGKAEAMGFTLRRGDTLCVTGPTGSGKSRLLEDVESLAAGDSPSGRQILLNGKRPTERQRELLENRLCASLAQTMNFVLEISCREFVSLHAKCRGLENEEELTERVLECANSLTGEAFSADLPVTRLSGGQSRAFMIADLVCLSQAPVVLIDEPENAGIDKHAVIELLSGCGKMLLISTHDPVLALSCQKRLSLKNGAISALRSRTAEEESLLRELSEADRRLQRVRELLREGGGL